MQYEEHRDGSNKCTGAASVVASYHGCTDLEDPGHDRQSVEKGMLEVATCVGVLSTWRL